MKKLTRVFCLFLVIPLLLCACEKKKPVEAPTEPPKSAQDYINSGEYEKAYDLLLALENPTEDEKAMLSRFYFLELENTSDDGYKLVCTYDEKGRLLTRDETTAKSTWSKLAYTYDEKGQVLTETTSSFSSTTDTSREQTYTYTYDENGNMLSETVTTHKGNEQDLRYIYDKYGNLVTQEVTYRTNPKVTYTSKWQLCYDPNRQ